MKLSEQTAGDAPQMSSRLRVEYQTTLMVLTHLLFVFPLIREFHRVAVQCVSCRNIQSTATRRFLRDKQSVDATEMISVLIIFVDAFTFSSIDCLLFMWPLNKALRIASSPSCGAALLFFVKLEPRIHQSRSHETDYSQ